VFEIGSSNVSTINGNEDISFQSFHFGYNAAEASTAIPVVNNLLHKVHDLLERWPGNHILFEIVRAGDHILRMSSKSSLYQILVNIENLSRKSQAWEQVSSREFSIATELKSISKLIIKWRKLELKSWPSLLKYQEDCIEKSASKWWLRLYSAIAKHDTFAGEASTTWINGKYVQDKSAENTGLKELYDVLDTFIRTSNVGEYKIRLKFLKMFSNQCLTQANFEGKAGYKRVGHFLEHVYRYHLQHQLLIDDTHRQIKSPVEKKLTDHLKLSKWDDQTYYSLKESSEKSHRILYRIVKEYKNRLLMPIDQLIDVNVNSNGGAGGSENLQDVNVYLKILGTTSTTV
jgi:midasin